MQKAIQKRTQNLLASIKVVDSLILLANKEKVAELSEERTLLNYELEFIQTMSKVKTSKVPITLAMRNRLAENEEEYNRIIQEKLDEAAEAHEKIEELCGGHLEDVLMSLYIKKVGSTSLKGKSDSYHICTKEEAKKILIENFGEFVKDIE